MSVAAAGTALTPRANASGFVLAAGALTVNLVPAKGPSEQLQSLIINLQAVSLVISHSPAFSTLALVSFKVAVPDSFEAGFTGTNTGIS